MTRAEVLAQYDVDSNGVIRSPGKFEAEMLYVPYFWDSLMNGFSDEDIAGEAFFVVDADDRRLFPELGDIYGLSLWESDQGFVYCTEYATKEAYEGTIAIFEAQEQESDEDED